MVRCERGVLGHAVALGHRQAQAVVPLQQRQRHGRWRRRWRAALIEPQGLEDLAPHQAADQRQRGRRSSFRPASLAWMPCWNFAHSRGTEKKMVGRAALQVGGEGNRAIRRTTCCRYAASHARPGPARPRGPAAGRTASGPARPWECKWPMPCAQRPGKTAEGVHHALGVAGGAGRTSACRSSSAPRTGSPDGGFALAQTASQPS